MSEDNKHRLTRRHLTAAALAAAATGLVGLPGRAAATPLAGPLATAPHPAGAAASGAPFVVPALREWAGGEGEFRLSGAGRITVPAGSDRLLRLARKVTAEIAELTGVRLRTPGFSDSAPHDGEIHIRVDSADSHPAGGERYRTEGSRIVVGPAHVIITAPAYAGAFYATRSLLQILVGEGRRALPAGTAVDWPGYARRGFMLDVGRRWFEPSFVRDYVRYMSWFKYNTFQIHLNDNEITAPDGDWSKAYSAFRLASDAPELAGLAAEDGVYTRPMWDELEDVAADHCVQVIPEIDAPAHARAFIEFKPELGLHGGNSDHLDLTKPGTTEFMKSLYDEFVPWFRSPIVHFGADEYPKEYAEQYRTYFNTIAAHLRSLGARPMAWGSMKWMTGTAEGYDRDVLLNMWSEDWYTPTMALEDGYHYVNTDDTNLYIVPLADYYHGRTGLDGAWLYQNWEPNVSRTERVEPMAPGLEGAMSAVWNDLVHADYDGEVVHGLVEPTFGLLAQKMWRGVQPGQTYEEFMAGVRRLGVGPGAEHLTSTLDSPPPR
ncbi:family 20 glycosylhydrolase [Streptomyces cavernicola]|uniref:Family 20 glycosylhydrolase n=1 Tax=Streptomyces cavernicola TaxID=3043613 RepID=A0ABT6SEX5_9ACTN|nr:family 20 glycosylhydrolase [Streptomyces sp. B-S-A6]MDI3406479.1 family 20 glycosylhydrolase [Streptomyces sp. B-S-A6]